MYECHFENYCVPSPRVVLLRTVRDQLRKQVRHGGLMDRSYVLVLLDYCLGDVIDEEAAAVLQGLPLVPLSDGGWAVFGRRGKGNVFVCNELECKIFQSLPSKVVSRKIPGMVLSRLESIAHLSSTNLCPLTEVFLLEMLPYLMPAEWRNQDEVEWSANECRGTSTPPFDHNLHDLESVEFAGGRSFGKYGKDCWPP